MKETQREGLQQQLGSQDGKAVGQMADKSDLVKTIGETNELHVFMKHTCLGVFELALGSQIGLPRWKDLENAPGKRHPLLLPGPLGLDPSSARRNSSMKARRGKIVFACDGRCVWGT